MDRRNAILRLVRMTSARRAKPERRVRLLGDPVLRIRCSPVTNPRSTAVKVVLDELRETLAELQRRHGLGRALAAPQIGAPIRVVYADLGKPWVLINPEIVDVGTDDFLVWDDCFSFPSLMVRVQRAYRIRVRYQDLGGKTHTVDLENDGAELVQHEIDHLDGVLAVDRPVGVDPFCLRDEWDKHYTNRARYGALAPRMAPA